MEAKAKVRNLRVSPLKARQVADLIRGKDIKEVIGLLRYTNKKSSAMIYKLIKSAVANAEFNNDMDADRLYLSEIMVDEGPTIKRVSPRAYGRADIIKRRTSHISVVLKERKGK